MSLRQKLYLQIIITFRYSLQVVNITSSLLLHTHTHTHAHNNPDPNDVIAPPRQFALIGQSYTLNCSSLIANPFISWLHNDADVPPTIPSVQLSDEGMYVCRVSVNGASIEKSVQFNVIGKIMITIPRCIHSHLAKIT